jgi:hypothetical protein
VTTPQGAEYLLTIIDDFSRRVFGFLVKSQTEWFDIWKKFVVRSEAEIGRPNCIAWLLSDNGSVYTSGEMKAFCAAKGIQQRFSAPYAQWMDHTAERNMRTIGEMGLTTIVHANLPKNTWGYAMLHAVEVINRTADSVEANKQAGVPANFSRLEKWKGKELPGQTKGLYPFGCLAFKHVPAKIRKKLDEHATPVVYLGLDPNCRAYLLGSLYHLELSASVEVTFVENVFPFRKVKHRESPSSLLWGTDNNMTEGDPRLGMFDSPDTSGVNKVLDRQALKSIGAIPAVDDQEVKSFAQPFEQVSHPVPSMPSVSSLPSDSALRRTSRVSKPPTNLKVYNQIPWQDYPEFSDNLVSDESASLNFASMFLALTETQLQAITPQSAEQALRCKSSAQWLQAMNREKQCHVKNGTFGEEWHQRGDGPKPVPAGWVLKIKHRGEPIEECDLQPKQFKARVVIRGQ